MIIEELYARRQLPNRILPKHGIGCEVGVARGDHAELLLLSRPKELHLIDWWTEISEKKPEWLEHKAWVQRRFHDNPAIHIHDGDLCEVLPTFPTSYFDWVYIDANHQYKQVVRDIQLGLRVVKQGGILCGHDFAVQPDGWRTGVVRAVLQFLQDNRQHILIGISNTVNAEWVIRIGEK